MIVSRLDGTAVAVTLNFPRGPAVRVNREVGESKEQVCAIEIANHAVHCLRSGMSLAALPMGVGPSLPTSTPAKSDLLGLHLLIMMLISPNMSLNTIGCEVPYKIGLRIRLRAKKRGRPFSQQGIALSRIGS